MLLRLWYKRAFELLSFLISNYCAPQLFHCLTAMAVVLPTYPTIHVHTGESSLSRSNSDSKSLLEGAQTPPTRAISHSDDTRGDPHLVPAFSADDPPSSPVLYLPPILSALPPGYTHRSLFLVPGGPTPLSTDSHLPSIDEASLSLHRALHHFRPITPEYASVSYPDAFNWDELRLPEHDEREWYCVVFRSRRREGSNSGPLYDADRKAHEEAVQNGGLLLYWYGTPHPETRMNLATCIWQSRAHAIAANSRPHHIRAMRLAAASYEHYELKRYWLCKAKGEVGVTIKPFENEHVERP